MALTRTPTCPGAAHQAVELPFDVSGFARWAWRVKSGIFHVSCDFKSHLNYSADNFPTTFLAWTRIIHFDDWASNKRRLMDHLEGREPIYASENRVMTKDGAPRWVPLCGKAIWDAEPRDGALICLNGGEDAHVIGQDAAPDPAARQHFHRRAIYP